MQSTNWASEHSDALREYLAKGMSYSEIAQAINARFKTAYSRSAAIGRASRMGLAGPDRAKDLPEDLPKDLPKHWPAPPKAPQPRLRKPRERYVPGFIRPMPDVQAHRDRQAPLCRDRSAPCFARRSRAGRLPLSLRRRGGGRSHHLLRSPAAPRLKLLRSTFSSDAWPRHRIGTVRRHRLTPACGGGMKRRATDGGHHEAAAASPPRRAFA